MTARSETTRTGIRAQFVERAEKHFSLASHDKWQPARKPSCIVRMTR